MTTANSARARYTSDAITTASPARLLLMLFDRLVRDLVAAEDALGRRDLQVAHDQLLHAQAILLELDSSLDQTVWDGAKGLSDLYVFLHSELVAANLGKDAARVRTVRDLVEPLQQTWREAALAAVAAVAS